MDFVYSRGIYTGGSGACATLIGPWAHGELRTVQCAVSGTCIRRGIGGSVLTLVILILILIIIAVVGYFVSLRIHPLARCGLCTGTGRHSGSVYTDAHRRCRRCGGSGRKDRFGTRLFG
jgi:hypothetical protein